MEHLYIHIPFCLKKCGYCDFFSVADLELIPKYLEALLTEIENASKKYPRQILTTLFLGGGTPSLLTPEQLEKILNKLKENFFFAKDLEFTLEANPETYQKAKFQEFQKLGLNRLSLGVQSFNDQELQYLGRVHDSKKARDALTGISEIFENFNLDLMYGLPSQTPEQALENLRTAISYRPKHISYYELTPVLTEQTELYSLGNAFLQKNNYLQYEISNYSLPGFECRHNLAYWSGAGYLGLGPGAHSFDPAQKLRWSNPTDLKNYLQKDFKIHSEPAKDFDLIIMGLRKTAGLPLAQLLKSNPEKTKEFLQNNLLLEYQPGLVQLTRSGQLLLNKLLLEYL